MVSELFCCLHAGRSVLDRFCAFVSDHVHRPNRVHSLQVSACSFQTHLLLSGMYSSPTVVSQLHQGSTPRGQREYFGKASTAVGEGERPKSCFVLTISFYQSKMSTRDDQRTKRPKAIFVPASASLPPTDTSPSSCPSSRRARASRRTC